MRREWSYFYKGLDNIFTDITHNVFPCVCIP